VNSDLNVLLSIFIDNTLQNVAIKIPDGLNTFQGYEYYGEPDIQAKWLEILTPLNLEKGIICGLEIIVDIMCVSKTNTHVEDIINKTREHCVVALDTLEDLHKLTQEEHMSDICAERHSVYSEILYILNSKPLISDVDEELA
jgi:hypothetical protein